jgi:hypothetical protein
MWISMASNPASTAWRAAVPNSSTTASSWVAVAALTRPIAGALNRVLGASDGVRLDSVLATSPACPIWAHARAPSACTTSVSRRSPGTESAPSTMVSRCTRPPGETAKYATVVIAAPPRATPAWKSISSAPTRPRAITPSNVAALMNLFFSVSGPNVAGANAFDTIGIEI